MKYKPNALDKARFEFSPLGKAFSTGLDKNVQGYQEEGVIKLLKDIRDSLAGNVIIPAKPSRPNDIGDDNGNGDGNDDEDNNGSDDGNDDGDDNGNDDGDLMEKIMEMMIEMIEMIKRVLLMYHG